MQGLSSRLADGDVIVADGALGTMLLQRGLAPGDCPDALSLSRPELLEEIAGLYLRAGAELLQAATFGASPIKLSDYGLSGKAELVNQRAVEAARKAARGRAWVYAPMGPTGRLLKPLGDASPEEVFESYYRQARAAAGAGADLLCVETMSDLAEATLAVRAAKAAAPSLPVSATMTFERTKSGLRTLMGTRVAQAAEGLRAAGADAVGANCGRGAEETLLAIREFRAACRLPLVARPNAGPPEVRDGRPFYAEPPEFLAVRARDFLAAGASVLGGCCGTTPEHVAALREALEAVRG